MKDKFYLALIKFPLWMAALTVFLEENNIGRRPIVKGEYIMNNNQTIKNMELILKNMESENARRKNYKALKTLSNSYFTLLKQLFMFPDELKNQDTKLELESQIDVLKSLKNKLEEDSIPELLKDGKYVDVNHLTTTTSKLYDSIKETLYLLRTYVYPALRETILVVSSNRELVEKQISKLAEEAKEELIQETRLPQGYEAVTRSYKFIAHEYKKENASLRGKRFDKIYIDQDTYYNNMEDIFLLTRQTPYIF